MHSPNSPCFTKIGDLEDGALIIKSCMFSSCNKTSKIPNPIVCLTKIEARRSTSEYLIRIFLLLDKSCTKSLATLKNTCRVLSRSLNSSSVGLCSDKTVLAALNKR